MSLNVRKWPTSLGALMLPLALMSGCGNEGDPACLASIDPDFILEIRDSVTSEGRAVQSVAIVVDGAFSDTLPLSPVDSNTLWRQGPMQRGGTYNLTVTAPSYQSWAMQHVTVPSNSCGVSTVRLQVLLQPN